MVLVCTPNNPTGPAVTQAELDAFLAKVPPQVLVVVDEAYVEFVRMADAVDGVATYRRHENVVLTRTFSKAYGLAGFRVGYAVGPAPLAGALRAVSLPFGVSGVAQAAAVASLEREPELLERVDALVAERDRVVAGLADAGWDVPEPQGNFVWFELGDRTLDFAEAADEAGIVVRPFAGEGARVTIGETEANDRLVDLVAKWVREGVMTPYRVDDDFERDTDYVADRITRDAATAGRWSRAATGWSPPRRARGRPARSSCAACSASRTRSRWGWPVRCTTTGRGPSTSTRAGRTRCSASTSCARPTNAASPSTTRASPCPPSSTCATGFVVTSDFPMITHDLFFEWSEHHRPDAPDLWPDAVRDEMDEVMERVYTEVNNGVYRCGFAGTQRSYDAAYDRLFAALDWLEDRLTRRRYLMGDAITEADVRLFTTLARFDAVYHGHFKCDRNKLTEMPALWGYARDLFQTPAFGDATDFEQIKQHYYRVQDDINPSGIVPKGPDTSGWLTPHGREALSDA